MKIQRFMAAGVLTLAIVALGCASGFGESYVWKRACGTDAQRQADRDACLSESAGLADPSDNRGVEYAQDLFGECMEARGWQRVPSSTALKCE